VEFRKNIYTEEYLRKLGLNERQINAVAFLKEKEKISNKDYRKLSGLSDEGARKDLNELVEKNILDLKGKGRNTHYVLKRVGD
jgi:ATP-dependent DNA helicase RecG